MSRRVKRVPWFEIVICAVLLVVVIAIVAHAINLGRERLRLKDECEERGGRIVEVRGTRDNGWFCWER